MIKIKNKFKNFLNKEHIGAESFEFIILSPLMFATFLVLLYFFFMSLTYISYNNVANSIAQELNMRQSGYKEAIENYSTMPIIYTYKAGENMPNGKTLKTSDVLVEPYSQELLSGTYFALYKYKDQFIIPFTELNSVKVISTKPIKLSDGKKMAGAVIKVQINYRTTVFGGVSLPMKAIGYNVIS